MKGDAVRFLCLIAVLVLMPMCASAQVWGIDTTLINWSMNSQAVDSTMLDSVRAQVSGDHPGELVFEFYCVDTIGYEVDTLDHDPNATMQFYGPTIRLEAQGWGPRGDPNVQHVQFWICKRPIVVETIIRCIHFSTVERGLGDRLQVRKVRTLGCLVDRDSIGVHDMYVSPRDSLFWLYRESGKW